MRFSDVLVHFKGRRVDIARALNITPGAVSLWGELVPPRRAAELEKLTKRKLKFDPAVYQVDRKTI
jgi:hypothetical protein